MAKKNTLSVTAAKKRSPCPIACGLDIFGDKWTLLVLRDLMSGKKRYGDFLGSPEGIPTNILADRLERLTQWEIIRPEPYQDHPVRYEYHLTEAGKDLMPVIKSMATWGLRYLPGTRIGVQVAKP